jgi:hypothetical protein
MSAGAVFPGLRPQVLKFGIRAEANEEDCSHGAEHHQQD